MVSNMRKACKAAFPNASLVIDRFHVVRLVMDAMRHARIDQCWKEIDKENEAIQQARSKGARYKPLILSNGDTPKQLLARSRYLTLTVDAVSATSCRATLSTVSEYRKGIKAGLGL